MICKAAQCDEKRVFFFIDPKVVNLIFFFFFQSLPQTPKTPKSAGSVLNGGDGSCSSSETVDDSGSEADNSLVYQDNNLVSGQLDALLQHLVPTADYYPDRTYIFAFLLSSRLYIKPHALLAQVVRLCMLQQNLADQKLTKVINFNYLLIIF